MFQIDKQKYIQIMKTNGLNAALTALHRDSEQWEYQTFEGEGGWKPEDWEKMREVRNFSRELWDQVLRTG
jgi:hypothetical protein